MCVCVCVSPPPLAVARGVRGSQSLPTIAPYFVLAWLGRSQSLTLSLTPLRFAVARLGVLAGRSRSHAIPSFSCLVLTVASSASPNRPLSYAVSVGGASAVATAPPLSVLLGLRSQSLPQPYIILGFVLTYWTTKAPQSRGFVLVVLSCIYFIPLVVTVRLLFHILSWLYTW